MPLIRQLRWPPPRMPSPHARSFSCACGSISPPRVSRPQGGGEGALGALPALIPTVPEARTNLAVYHLRGGRLAEAAALVEDIKPASPPEYLLKATVAASLGQLVLLGKWSGASHAALAAASACLKGVHPKEVL